MKKVKNCYVCDNNIYNIPIFMKKKEKVIGGCKVIVCPHCGAYNSPYEKIKK